MRSIFLKFFKVVLLIGILVGLYFSAYFVIHGDLGYDTDIARDFLVMQDAVNTHKLPLIGPRTGGIDGLFHGPLWYYINLPVFIIDHGNPVIVGWFWIILVASSIFTTYYLGKKIFNSYVGLLSSLLLSFVSITYSNVLLNPFGAVILSPLFFLCFYEYINSLKLKYLVLSFFIIGLMIQFEVAFGGPILILSILYLAVFLYKKGKLHHFSSLFVLFIPFSTYILFDLRHNFLQTRAILNHFYSPTGNGKTVFAQIFQNRVDALLGSFLLNYSFPILLTILLLMLFIYIIVISLVNKKLKARNFYLLFAYFYLGYWPLSFYLNGYVLGFHVLPFLPIAMTLLSSSYLMVRKEITAFLFICVFLMYILTAKTFIGGFYSYSGTNAGSWKFNYQLAQKVYSMTKSNFGYYVFTPDEWGYGPRYAINYVQKAYPQYSASPNTKEYVTFIVLAPTENGPNNNRIWWIKNRVKINRSPINEINYSNGYTIYKYLLTKDETKIPSDPNLVNGLFFR